MVLDLQGANLKGGKRLWYLTSSNALLDGVNLTLIEMLRYANISDSEVISKLVLESSLSVKDQDFTSEGWSLLEQTNTAEAVRKRFESKSYFALLYEVDKVVAGYIAMLDFEKIDHMFVLPEFRNRGLAKKLWTKAEQICADSGKGHYYWVRSSSYAEPVYESFGFRSSGAKQSSNGISYRLMEKGKKSDAC